MGKKEEKIKGKNIDEIISTHVYWSVGAGLIPVPIADIAAVTAVQTDMLKQLCKQYKIDYTEEQGKVWISALATSTMSSLLAKVGASAVKFIPVVGTMIGATSMALMSGATTYALGKAFAKHFEEGGDFEKISKEQLKKFYDERMEEGKKLAGKLKKRYTKLFDTPEGKEKEKKAADKIKELDKMKKSKQITEKEYDKMRKDILKKFLGEDKDKSA